MIFVTTRASAGSHDTRFISKERELFKAMAFSICSGVAGTALIAILQTQPSGLPVAGTHLGSNVLSAASGQRRAEGARKQAGRMPEDIKGKVHGQINVQVGGCDTANMVVMHQQKVGHLT